MSVPIFFVADSSQRREKGVAQMRFCRPRSGARGWRTSLTQGSLRVALGYIPSSHPGLLWHGCRNRPLGRGDDPPGPPLLRWRIVTIGRQRHAPGGGSSSTSTAGFPRVPAVHATLRTRWSASLPRRLYRRFASDCRGDSSQIRRGGRPSVGGYSPQASRQDPPLRQALI